MRSPVSTRNFPAANANRYVEMGCVSAKRTVVVSPEAARYLAQRGVRLVGVDYLSVGAFQEESGRETHRALLSAGIWIVEGLVLKDIAPGEYDLICLPLRIVGSDGAPARAVLRSVQS